jgi:hypothetical protein
MIYYKSIDISDNSDAFTLKPLHQFYTHNKYEPQLFSYHSDLLRTTLQLSNRGRNRDPTGSGASHYPDQSLRRAREPPCILTRVWGSGY